MGRVGNDGQVGQRTKASAGPRSQDKTCSVRLVDRRAAQGSMGVMGRQAGWLEWRRGWLGVSASRVDAGSSSPQEFVCDEQSQSHTPCRRTLRPVSCRSQTWQAHAGSENTRGRRSQHSANQRYRQVQHSINPTFRHRDAPYAPYVRPPQTSYQWPVGGRPDGRRKLPDTPDSGPRRTPSPHHRPTAKSLAVGAAILEHCSDKQT